MSTLPAQLFYYTDAFGVQGILTPLRWPGSAVPAPDGSALDNWEYTFGRAAHLMASDIGFMNDTQELLFGTHHVAAALERASNDSVVDPQLGKAFASIARMMNEVTPGEWPWRWYAACFCEDGDLLSQWRGYAGGMGGFAIGFTGDALARHSYVVTLAARGMLWDMPFPVELHQVRYGEQAAQEAAEQLVNDLQERTLITDLSGFPLYDVGLAAFRVAATLKHEAFAAEREWRLLTVVEKGYRTMIRPRSGGLLPYLDFVVNPRWSPDGPDLIADRAVTSVRVGPAHDQAGQVEAVKLLLHNRGADWLHEVDVQASGTPYSG